MSTRLCQHCLIDVRQVKPFQKLILNLKATVVHDRNVDDIVNIVCLVNFIYLYLLRVVTRPTPPQISEKLKPLASSYVRVIEPFPF